MNIIETSLPGVLIIEPKVHQDNRGFFMESYSQKEFDKNKLNYNFVQDNHSLSVELGVLRGLHYQLNPKAQTKLVRCISGSIYDVVVDIRKNSATFGCWFGIELSAINKRQLLVPKGFAHGFCTLEKNTEVVYKVDEYYDPQMDRGIYWNDPDIGISWPLNYPPILSEKDSKLPRLMEAEINFE
ncbi:dTDP-4-dehydrorhamnose 3,5-epimerase [Paenibacillus hamazuiensis]|uniref:dTDP-4-dehydrorhamnose 3,5-epimerase n=1 Tax=Paenibacillus hamazuiensis TaxID=2936508 RepID=UPI00200BEC22|nr:dTDP-4-dehydrorhamnose 3,5-epimerase [Paenibacillus hamazuiensis]